MRLRLTLVMTILIFFGLFLGGKLVFIQLVKGKAYSHRAVSMQRRFIREEPVPRGDILDRNLQSLTDTRAGLALVLFPGLVADMGRVRDGMRSVFGDVYNLDQLPAGGIWEKPVVLNTFTSFEQAAQVQRLNLPGLYIVPLTIRYGPNSLARHIVGHLTAAGKTFVPVFGGQNGFSRAETGYSGDAGIEREYDPELSYGESSSFWSLFYDARGNLVPGLSFKKVELGQPANRYSVVLTLDKELQAKVESIMDRKVGRGAVVVMDALTGEVLAAASRPNYRQDRVQQYLIEEHAPLLNRVFNNYYPGSVFKIVVAAAALEEGLVQPDEVFNCTGSYRFKSGLEIPCWKAEGHGRISFARAFAFSCNPAFIEVALRLGRERLWEYAKAFGLEDDAVAGYSLPIYESVDIGHSAGDLANAAVGQKGVRISPLKVAAMTAVIASGGTWHSPRLVDSVVDGRGRIVETVPGETPRRVISVETAKKVQAMMELTTTEGTGKRAWLPGGAAGKTSSAETGQLDKQGKRIINAWFTGYVPLKEPRYVITVLVEGGNYGGKVAAPIFREIGEYLLRYRFTMPG